MTEATPAAEMLPSPSCSSTAPSPTASGWAGVIPILQAAGVVT